MCGAVVETGVATGAVGAIVSLPATEVGASEFGALGPVGFGIDAVWPLVAPGIMLSDGSLTAMSGVLVLDREHPSKTTIPPMTRTCRATTMSTTFETFMGSFRCVVLVASLLLGKLGFILSQ